MNLTYIVIETKPGNGDGNIQIGFSGARIQRQNCRHGTRRGHLPGGGRHTLQEAQTGRARCVAGTHRSLRDIFGHGLRVAWRGGGGVAILVGSGTVQVGEAQAL
jgi:hypothetical protein